MADDIVKRLRSEMHYRPDSAVIAAAADLIEAQQAEIERLRIERDDLQVLLKGRTAEFQAEIARLRAERDAERALADQLAKALDRHGSHSLCTMLCSVCVTLAAHQEARRG